MHNTAILKKIEKIAEKERRSTDEVLRDMMEAYERARTQREEGDAWVMNIIKEAQEEQKKNPMTREEIRKESDRLARYGEQQAKRLGIKERDIPRIIDEYRRSRRA
jgi:hypothetical protein